MGELSPSDKTVTSFLANNRKINKNTSKQTKGIIRTVAKL